jgi:hypothetical protein
MAVYCDSCVRPLSANDDSIYTENGGALCQQCRDAPISEIEYKISVRVEKIVTNERGFIFTSEVNLPFVSETTTNTRRRAMLVANLICQGFQKVKYR